MMSVASLNVGRHSVVAPAVVFVPGGRFRMGSEGGRADEGPVHDAQVRPVRVGRQPVTNLEYAWFLASGRVPEPPWWKDPSFWDPEQPVVGVTWFEAMSYCVWLGETFGGRWRLPTEAVGAGGPRRPRGGADGLGSRGAGRRGARTPGLGPLGGRAGDGQRLRAAGRGDDRPRVVLRLVRPRHLPLHPTLRPTGSGERGAPGEPRRLLYTRMGWCGAVLVALGAAGVVASGGVVLAGREEIWGQSALYFTSLAYLLLGLFGALS